MDPNGGRGTRRPEGGGRGARTRREPGRVLGVRPAPPPPRRRSGRSPNALCAPVAQPAGSACASAGRRWRLNAEQQPFPTARARPGGRGRARGAGVGGLGFGGRGRSGGSEGKRFLVRAERGESGSAPRRREELSVCSPLLPPSLALPPPPALLAKPGGAGSRSGGGGPSGGAAGSWAAARGRRASVPLFVGPGPLSPLPRGAGPREHPDERKAARESGGRAAGARGAMSYQGKKSIPHITVSRAPAPPRPAGRSLWSGVVAARVGIRPGIAGAAPEAGGVATVGAGPASALQPPPPSLWGQWWWGAPRGGAGASSPSPRGLADPPSPPRELWTGGCGAEQKKEGRRGPDSLPPSLEPRCGGGLRPRVRPPHGPALAHRGGSFFPARGRRNLDHRPHSPLILMECKSGPRVSAMMEAPLPFLAAAKNNLMGWC